MVVAHNMSAMNAQRQFSVNTKNRAKATEKLSSGFRINRAADDAAGLSISEKMRKQIRGLDRGVENAQEGVGMCQVADGALAEVNKMLHRMTELSVQAANGTNSTSDRRAIQEEINEILTEIERISETTKFNETRIFEGNESKTYSITGSVIEAGDIPFQDFALADVNLGNTPFNAGSNADHLNLRAIVNNQSSSAYGQGFNLIFGSGSTSNSSFRISTVSGTTTINKQTVNLDNITPSNYNYQQDTQTWTRDFVYNQNGYNVVISQKVQLEETNSGAEKNYIISYDFKNNDAVDPNDPTSTADSVKFEFMFHADTAYNDNDQCEGYYVNGQRLEKYVAYTEDDSQLIQGADPSPYIKGDIPDSFSVVDVDRALSFSEKISFDRGGTKPDTLSIGHYSAIDDWSYYNGNLDNHVGVPADRQDLGFSLYYDMDTIDVSASKSITFRYGIIATQTDTNLNGVETKRDTKAIESVVRNDKQVWIQSGAETGDGIILRFGSVDTKSLGIDEVNVLSIEGAEKSIRSVDRALLKVNANRSMIGAQQNRLEHTIANEDNIIENTTAAESRIRDVDMAEAMVEYSKENILAQAGQAMMAQANRSTEGVLSLLS